MCCNDDWKLPATGAVSLSLEGEWLLCGVEPGAPMAPDRADWISAQVPGEIHLDLMAAGRIPDPFVDEQYRESLWVEERDWWLCDELIIPPGWETLDRVELVFEGLDTVAHVFWNGEEIGSSRNMWVPLTIDVTDRVRAGEVVMLAVRFRSHLDAARERMPSEPDPMVTGFFSPVERTYLRKAQMSFGWDIAPRIATYGIWRPVRLEGFQGGALRDVCFRSRLTEGGGAVVSIAVEAEGFSGEGPWSVRVEAAPRSEALRDAAPPPSGHSDREVTQAPPSDRPEEPRRGVSKGSSLAVEIPLREEGGRLVGEAEVALDSPVLWWTWDTGTPALYEATTTLLRAGAEVHRRGDRFGIREVALHLSDPETGGNRFFFTLNGRPLFLCGTNWIPVDAIFARVTTERIRAVLDLSRELSVNCLRIWGGGIYEEPAFHDLCDEMGMLVWQDFMYACALYPREPWFLEEARVEAEWVVRSLRNHPSMLIWSGDNECDCSYQWHGKPGSYVENQVTRGVLPEVTARLDPTRPYIPSSPWNPSETGDPNCSTEGDTHLWSHDQPPRAPMYSEDRSFFLSEIGRISPAPLETIEAFLSPANRWPHANPVWDQHLGTIPTTDFHRRDRMDDALRNTLGFVPETLPEYVEASQLLQSWCLSEWIERARRRWPECGGILWWNVFDNWPQHSDAVVDYYFRKKPAFAAIKRVSEPVALSIALAEGEWQVWLLNSTDAEVAGKVTLALACAEGASSVASCAAVGAANRSTCVLRVPAGEADHETHWLVATGLAREARTALDGCRSVAVLREVYGG